MVSKNTLATSLDNTRVLIDAIVECASMQDKMNCVVNPEWAVAGYNWLRCARMEAVEAIDHFGWKHWKHQIPDLPQCKMELVDILHFGLSHELVYMLHEDAAVKIIAGLQSADTEQNLGFLYHIEEFIFDTRAEINWEQFFLACDALELSFEELVETYVGKNALNIFRQDNGYKDGTYIKEWGGAKTEDNVFLEMIIKDLKEAGEKVTLSAVTDRLGELYRLHNGIKGE